MKKILFLDDEPEFVRPQVTALEESGYEVILVSDVNEAMTALLNDRFDLILLDVIMPPRESEFEGGEDEFALIETGVKLHEEIREKLRIVDTPIIFITIVRDFEIRNILAQRELKHRHRPRFLTKPVSSATVVDEVKRALEEASF